MLVYMYTKPFGIYFGLNPQPPTRDAGHHQDNYIQPLPVTKNQP